MASDISIPLFTSAFTVLAIKSITLFWLTPDTCVPSGKFLLRKNSFALAAKSSILAFDIALRSVLVGLAASLVGSAFAAGLVGLPFSETLIPFSFASFLISDTSSGVSFSVSNTISFMYFDTLVISVSETSPAFCPSPFLIILTSSSPANVPIFSLPLCAEYPSCFNLSKSSLIFTAEDEKSETTLNIDPYSFTVAKKGLSKSLLVVVDIPPNPSSSCCSPNKESSFNIFFTVSALVK